MNQNQAVTSLANLEAKVVLANRDDFDHTNPPAEFEEAINHAGTATAHQVANLRELLIQYYPWIPNHVFDTVDSQVTAEINARDNITAEAKARIYCEKLQNEYDDWVTQDVDTAQRMYIAEADLEELYEVASTTAHSCPEGRGRDLTPHIDRAQKEFLSDRRVEIVLEQVERGVER
ncbi:hypothetical protein [Salinibaculum rarum]|uniref:hypothetical protein n=1 Tax=Salinibaculum rarum TaxID=3058903 RepID=UPI00265DCB31|nr:hypothetical protein [Salinibaculum sp. KK48]